MASERMKRVMIESPYAGDVERNKAYLRRCFQDSFDRGEAPYASHALYTQFLDDTVPEERYLGLAMGLAWGEVSSKIAVYMDYGISPGMKSAIEHYKALGIEIDYRKILPSSAEDR